MLATVNIKTSVSKNMQRQNATTIIVTKMTAKKDTKSCVDMETNVLTKTKTPVNLGMMIKLPP
jgi:hypothetical protein